MSDAKTRLIPYRPERQERRPGIWQRQVTIAPDFDDFTAADERNWYGKELQRNRA